MKSAFTYIFHSSISQLSDNRSIELTTHDMPDWSYAYIPFVRSSSSFCLLFPSHCKTFRLLSLLIYSLRQMLFTKSHMSKLLQPLLIAVIAHISSSSHVALHHFSLNQATSILFDCCILSYTLFTRNPSSLRHTCRNHLKTYWLMIC